MDKQVVGICGHFGFGKNLVNGQTIKTKIFTEELEKKIGKNRVKKIDSCNAGRHLLMMTKKCRNLLKECDAILMFPASRGLLFFVPVFYWLNKIYKKRIYYVVIGGWLTDFLGHHKLVSKYLKSINGIFVETFTMKKCMSEMLFENVSVVANIKQLDCIDKLEIKQDFAKPYKICTFSRVEKSKGIEDAIDIVRQINEKYGEIIYLLDIYGPVQPEYTNRFEKLKKDFPDYIQYCGIISSKDTVRVIKNYYFLLFPTKYYTEGVPGTIIDAYSAGVPVVCSKWESFGDVVVEEKTGYGYNFGDLQDMFRVIDKLYFETEKCIQIRQECLKEAKKFSPEVVIENLIDKIGIC